MRKSVEYINAKSVEYINAKSVSGNLNSRMQKNLKPVSPIGVARLTEGC